MRDYLSILLLLLTSGLFAQEAETLIETNRILIGDQVRISLMLETKAQDTVVWPEIGDTLISEVEVISRTGIDTAYDSRDISLKLYTQDLIITSFDSGYYAVPPFKYLVNGKSVKSNAFLLQVGNVQLDTADAIKDIKAPIPVDYGFIDWLKDYWHWVIAGLLVLALIILLIRYYLRKSKEKPQIAPEKPKEPAHVIAKRKLAALEEKRLWQHNKTKEYHSELTDIIREYLELRFDIHAMEQTSDEIMQSLRFKELKEKEKQDLRRVLLLADLVKFAKEKPIPEENKESMMLAYQFVDSSKEQKSANKEESNSDV